uniref:Protein DPCD n=1 Tax=Eptatretus burgeri TaxID=7764 RepID=A0A8C4Q353_EPTBU
MIVLKFIGPDMFSWMRHCVAEAYTLLRALSVLHVFGKLQKTCCDVEILFLLMLRLIFFPVSFTTHLILVLSHLLIEPPPQLFCDNSTLLSPYTGRRKVHFTFADGKEMVEEYHLTSEDLLLRKWRQRSALGALGHWEVEIGNAGLTKEDHPDGHLRENINMPKCIRMDTQNAFQWRIRNLPYPPDVYSLAVDPERQRCIIKTTNKKYYKTLSIPDMERYGLPLESSALSFTHKNNTLVITISTHHVAALHHLYWCSPAADAVLPLPFFDALLHQICPRWPPLVDRYRDSWLASTCKLFVIMVILSSQRGHAKSSQSTW